MTNNNMIKATTQECYLATTKW